MLTLKNIFQFVVCLSTFNVELIGGITVEDTITQQITHPSPKCHGKTITNSFDARITHVKAGETYQGTLLMVPGGNQLKFIGDPTLAGKDGQKELMDDLWDLGYRILEIRWEYSLTEDSRYADSYHCPMYGLAQALEILVDENIGSTANKWWPSSQSDRYAFGTSSGQISIQFAVDKWTNSETKMNRVVYGGGGISYDIFDILDCTEPNNTKVLEQIEFLYDGAISKCTNDITCDGDTALAAALDEASLKNYIGTGSDDLSRANKVLFNTGNDWGCNNDLNNAYYTDRLGTAGTDKKMWDLEDTWCTYNIWGHYIINTVYDERPHVGEWFDFIVDGIFASNISCT